MKMFITGYLTTGNDLTATKCTHYVYVHLATLKFYIFSQKLIDFFFLGYQGLVVFLKMRLAY